MRPRLKLSALLALMFLAFSLVGGTGVGAQDDAEDAFQPGDLEGLEYGVSRFYVVDYAAMFAMSTPDAEMTMPSGTQYIGGMVLEFDDSSNAEVGYDRVLEVIDEELLTDDQTVEEFDVELGNASIGFVSTDESDGVETQSIVIMVQEDNVVYLTSVASSGADMTDDATSFTEALIDNDGSGEGEFHEDGTSTGGLWDKFPSSDDEMFTDLVVTDEIVFPEPEDASN